MDLKVLVVCKLNIQGSIQPKASLPRNLEETLDHELETFDGKGSKDAPEKEHNLSAERHSEIPWTAP